MSDSYHVTIKDVRGLSVKELEEQSKDRGSDLVAWAKKSRIKHEKIKSRKSAKQIVGKS
jgi:hypothetical protein